MICYIVYFLPVSSLCFSLYANTMQYLCTFFFMFDFGALYCQCMLYHLGELCLLLALPFLLGWRVCVYVCVFMNIFFCCISRHIARKNCWNHCSGNVHRYAKKTHSKIVKWSYVFYLCSISLCWMFFFSLVISIFALLL